MKKLWTILLAAIACVSLTGCFGLGLNIDGAEITKEVADGINEYQRNKADGGSGVLGVSEQSFSTPEAAIEHFVGAVTDNDLEGALEACAIYAYGTDFDFHQYSDRLSVIMPGAAPAPAEYDMFADLNQLQQAATMGNYIRYFCYSFFIDEDLSMPIVLGESDISIEDFMAAVDPAQLHSLEIVRMDEPMPEVLHSETNTSNFDRQAASYGADGMTEMVVLYDLNGQLYCGGFGLLNYGGDWKICRLNSMLAGQPAYGTVAPITESEYQSVIS